jgi:hypothetical protein
VPAAHPGPDPISAGIVIPANSKSLVFRMMPLLLTLLPLLSPLR